MEDIKEIKQDVKVLLQQSAVHNEILRTHEARSLALQQEQKAIKVELEPIKTHVKFMDIMMKGLGAIAIGVLVQYIITKVLNLL